MKHTCHAPDCDIEIPRAMLMCKKHWVMVPVPMQKRVYKHFRPEQLRDQRPSIEWLWAASDAQTAVALKIGKLTEAQAAAKYADNVQRFHQQATLRLAAAGVP